MAEEADLGRFFRDSPLLVGISFSGVGDPANAPPRSFFNRCFMVMIKEASVRAEIAEEWAALNSLAGWSRSYAVGGAFINETPPESFYNLPLVLAYSILDDVLKQLIIEKQFPCKNNKGNECSKLGERMLAAKNAINWVNYALVDNGREARNDLAHHAKLSTKADCLKYISAIGEELRGWGLIS